MTKIVVTKEWTRKNWEYVIYNYLASKTKITAETMQEELKNEYDIRLTTSEVQEVISDYVCKGILVPHLRYYTFCSY